MDETSGQQRSARMMDVDTKRDVERTADSCLFLKPFPLIFIYVTAILISISIEIIETICCNETSSPTSLLLERYGEVV